MNNAGGPMISHYIGRFMIQVPQSMNVVHRSASLRHRELRDLPWATGAVSEVLRKEIWMSRVKEIEKLPPPEGKGRALIEEREMTDPAGFTQAVLYFGDSDAGDRVFSEMLAARKLSGLWIKSIGVETKVQKMMEQNADIARAYHSRDPADAGLKANGFYLEHGYILLPYRSQEEAYARFEGHPLGLKLRIQTNETHEDEPHDEGLLGRLAATLATGMAAGVDVEKIRAGKRVVGGLKGEETVLRAKTAGKTDLSFIWRFAGKKDSGDQPEILIEIEAKDGQLDEKLKLWDAVLNSFKPAGR